jgi:hypothetical protein
LTQSVVACLQHPSIAAVEQATGRRPVGWSGPDFQETPSTPNLLAAEGIRYVCDWGNDEQPYRMTPKTDELYSLGVNAARGMECTERRPQRLGRPALLQALRHAALSQR